MCNDKLTRHGHGLIEHQDGTRSLTDVVQEMSYYRLRRVRAMVRPAIRRLRFESPKSAAIEARPIDQFGRLCRCTRMTTNYLQVDEGGYELEVYTQLTQL
jgi:hypothetical protein